MTTHSVTDNFQRDYGALSPTNRERLREALSKFMIDLPTGHFRAELRVRGVNGHPRVLEITWAPNHRATFEFGDEASSGTGPHIVWRRLGDHSILAGIDVS
jgi:hypothetical protein